MSSERQTNLLQSRPKKKLLKLMKQKCSITNELNSSITDQSQHPYSVCSVFTSSFRNSLLGKWRGISRDETFWRAK